MRFLAAIDQLIWVFECNKRIDVLVSWKPEKTQRLVPGLGVGCFFRLFEASFLSDRLRYSE